MELSSDWILGIPNELLVFYILPVRIIMTLFPETNMNCFIGIMNGVP